MKRLVGVWLALAASIAPALAEDADPEFKAYVLSLLTEKGKAQAEFAAAAKINAPLAAYSLGLLAQEKCHFQQPSKTLFDAGGGDDALKTATGKRIFVVAGVIATMKYETELEQTNACDKMRKVIESAETIAAGQ